MSYIGNLPFGKTLRTVTSATANGSATVFYPDGGYDVNFVDVFVSGARLTSGLDYTASDGISITLLYTPADGDTIDMVAYGLLELVSPVFPTSISVGSNVVINTSSISVGNSSVNTQIVAGNVTLNGSTLKVGNSSVNTVITGNSVTIGGTLTVTGNVALTTNSVNSSMLTTTGVIANSYGNTTAIPVITVDAAGRITNATTSSVSGVTGLSFAPANSTITVSTSTTNFDAAITSGNDSVQGLLKVIDSVSNTSTLIASSANSVTTAYLLAANAVSNATAYAATAYSNAVATAASDATTKAGTAYSNATAYADTMAGTAYSNAVATAASDATTKAGTAYSNATAYADTKAGTAYSNAISYANTAAGTAYSNAASYADTKAAAAYSNVFNGGTFSGAVVMQANLTANSVRMNGDLQIDGNLTVSGNTVSIHVSTLSVEDNMIYLNSNSTVSNPDLGFAGNYNDGTYAHAGLFRDATDGVWKFFHGYTPEPDASVYIDTSNSSFTLSNLQINYVIGNVTGSANSATYLGGNTASTLRTYSDTIAGTAYSNAVSVAASDATTKAGTAYSNATTYAATIAGTAYSNAVSVAASDATTKAGTAYSNATTYAATIAGTAYSNAVSVAASDATTKAGTAYSNATTYAATVAGTAYSNAIAFAANASNISSGTLSASRLPATYLTAESDTLATVTARGSTTSGAITISSGTTDQGLTMTVSDAGWNYIGFSHGATRKAYFGLDGSGNPQWGSDSGAFSITGNYTTIGTSARSPLFYDSDDTGYYMDMNSTGLAANFAGHVWIGSTSFANPGGWNKTLTLDGTNHARIRLKASAYGSYGANETYMWLDNTVTPNSGIVAPNVFYLNASYTQMANSARAPIFYDLDDTGYYIDPNSTSRVYKLLHAFNIVSQNYGIGHIGVYDSYRYQALWSMGEAYVLPADGTTTGNLYGIAWSHPNAGGIASNLASHGMLILENGTFKGAWGGGRLITPSDIRGTVLYDYSDTGYYLDPNATSNLLKFSTQTMSYNDMNALSVNSPYTSRYAGSANYRNGTMGYGTTDFNAMFSNWGSGFIDSWSSPSNAPGGSSHYVGIQGCHYNHQDGSQVYGFQMACAGEADNRFFWRRGWPGLTSWVEMIHTANINTLPSDLRAPIFYDRDNTAYSVNPNGTSQLQGHTTFGPYAGHVSSGNVSNVEIMNAGGTGDGNVAAISWHCQAYYGLQMHLRHDGYFGIGGWSASTWRWYVHNPTGDMVAAGNITAYSDPRLKEDVKVIESAIDKIKQLNGVKFKWIESSVIGRPGEYDYGILSTDVEKIAPELVVNSIHEAPEGDFYKTVAYDKLVAFTIEAIKEQQTIIESQEARIAKLEALINKLVG